MFVDRNGEFAESIEDIGREVLDFFYEYKEVLKYIEAGRITIVAVILLVAFPGLGTAIGTGILSGGIVGGLANYLTDSGSFINGYLGGAINGAMVALLGDIGYYISNAIGGGIGNIVTDILNNYDLLKEERKSKLDMLISMLIAAIIQGIVGGSLDDLTSVIEVSTDMSGRLGNEFLNYVKGVFGTTSGAIGGMLGGEWLAGLHNNDLCE